MSRIPEHTQSVFWKIRLHTEQKDTTVKDVLTGMALGIGAYALADKVTPYFSRTFAESLGISRSN